MITRCRLIFGELSTMNKNQSINQTLIIPVNLPISEAAIPKKNPRNSYARQPTTIVDSNLPLPSDLGMENRTEIPVLGVGLKLDNRLTVFQMRIGIGFNLLKKNAYFSV